MTDLEHLAIPRVSPTAAEGLLKCRARAIRITTHRSMPETPAIAIGNSAHGVAERVYRGDFDDVNVDEVRSAITAAFEAEIDERHARMTESSMSQDVPPPRRWKNFRLAASRLPRFLASEVERRRNGTAPRILALEDRIESADGVIFGYPDRVEKDGDTVRIVDLKSGLADPSGVPDRYKRQLMIYAYLWKEDSGEWPHELAIQRMDGRLEAVDFDTSEIEVLVANIRDRRDSTNSAIAAGAAAGSIADPSPANCEWCSRRTHCSPFLESLDRTFALGGPSIVGTINDVSIGELAQSVEVEVTAANTDDVGDLIRIVGIDKELNLESADTAVALDGRATSIPSQISLNSWSSFAIVAHDL